jgi:HD superfamily phosphohydrolase
VSTAKRTSVVRDPVHGDVELSHEELRLLDTREMQRLRGVKQLGSACLVFPGATHTRFDHSIGTLHLCGRMIEAINKAAAVAPRESLGIGAEEARVIRAAALLHDVTHIPFGHNVEDQAGLMLRHDSPQRFERMLGPGTELGRVLRDLGLARDVASVLSGPAGAAPAYWSQINSDTICSDILDYLQRDAHFTGLKLAIDPRILSYFRIDRASGNLYVDLAKHGLLREDTLSEIVRLLEARYHFSERVYYHHAKVSAGALIARAVTLLLSANAVREEDFYDATDASLLVLLTARGERLGGTSGRQVVSLVERFEARRLPKRVCVFPRRANLDVQTSLVERYFAKDRQRERAEVEGRIQDLVRFATGKQIDILVTCPARSMQLKEAATHVRWPGEDGVRPLSHYSDRVPRLADLEQSYRDLWKFYVFADETDPRLLAKIGEIAAGEFPGATNVYKPG